MTSRVRAVCRRAFPAKTGGAGLTGANVLAVACGLAFLGQLGLPAPAYAQWGKLEKLSGPGTFSGWAFEFRAACFGDPVDESSLDALTARAASATETARKSTERDSQQWHAAADAWEAAARAWAFELGHKFEPPKPHEIEKGRVDYQRLAEDLRAAVNRAPATLMATSSAGVAWSLCNPNKKRRLALDIGWITWESDPDPNYAGGASINLDTLMASISWRALQGTDFDFVEVSAGGGMYWFTSTGFESLKGVVLQPARLTLRAPSSWSGKSLKDIRRYAAIPVFAVGITMFPAGFEPNDFAGVGDRAVRIPSELLYTHYWFFNLEPFLRRGRK